jgi:hypothetical protein
MGGQKREIERLDSILAAAEQAATKAGHVERCEYHDEVLMIVGDDEPKREAFKIAGGMAKKREIDGTHGEIVEALQSVLDDASFGCPHEECPNADRT